MASTRFVFPALLTVLSLLVATSGLWVVYHEGWASASEPGTTDIGRVIHSLKKVDGYGISSLSKLDAVAACMVALSAPKALEMRFLPGETRDAIVPHCGQRVDDAVAAFPSSSYARAVRALAAARSGDWATLNDQLVRSHITGPTEQAFAQLRVTVALDNYVQLGEAARRATGRDLLMLMTTSRGSDMIARRYVEDEAFRTIMDALIATAPPELQKRFVDLVTRELDQVPGP